MQVLVDFFQNRGFCVINKAVRIALALIASSVAVTLFLKIACSPLWLLFFHFF